MSSLRPILKVPPLFGWSAPTDVGAGVGCAATRVGCAAAVGPGVGCVAATVVGCAAAVATAVGCVPSAGAVGAVAHAAISAEPLPSASTRNTSRRLMR